MQLILTCLHSATLSTKNKLCMLLYYINIPVILVVKIHIFADILPPAINEVPKFLVNFLLGKKKCGHHMSAYDMLHWPITTQQTWCMARHNSPSFAASIKKWQCSVAHYFRLKQGAVEWKISCKAATQTEMTVLSFHLQVKSSCDKQNY